MYFVDTHTHLYDAMYEGTEGQDAAVQRAVEAGVEMMILPDISIEERPAMLDLHMRNSAHTRPCLGLHPTEIKENWKEDLDNVESLLGSRDDIVAIGECGMDLYWSRDGVALQEEVFRIQLDMSLDKGLPVLIHAREATEPIFRILEDYRGRGLRGIFHAFSGSIETFRRLDRYGDWHVGIGGVLTFKKASIAATVADIPLERIVLETDSPYLTPVPHRGQRNESAYIPDIARFLAACKGCDPDTVADVTTANANKIFGL